MSTTRTIKLTRPQHSVADYRFNECAYEETINTSVTLTASTLSWDSADDRFVRSILDNAEDIVADWALTGSMSPAERGERQATNTLVRKAREAMTAPDTNPLNVATGDRVTLTDPSSYAAWRHGHVGRVIDVVDTDDTDPSGDPETILIVRCEDCTLEDGSPNNHYVSAVEVERVPAGRPVDLRKREVLSERRFIGRTGAQYGPMQLTVRLIRVDGCKATADGWHRTSYFVYDHNDRQLFGGVADHLPENGIPRDVHGVEVPAVEVDHNPVPVLDVDTAAAAIVAATGADIDPADIASDLSTGSSFSVHGHGRIYRPNADGTVSVYVNLDKPTSR